MLDAIELNPNKWIVGLSGGVDSVVLLHLLSEVVEPTDILAVHVNHHMHSKAYEWAAFCRQYAESLGVDYEELHIADSPPVAESVEAYFRTERYALFADLMEADDCLLTAHHLDDQVETVLHNLFRGAGIKGLAAMPSTKPFENGYHARPLLDMRKSELLNYATDNHLDWVEDPSNDETQYDRNFLRHDLVPMIASRYPGVENNIARSAGHCLEAQGLLDTLAKRDVPESASFDLALLDNKSIIEKKWLLRFWLGSNAFKVSTVQLDELIEQLNAASDRQVTFENSFGELRRFDNKLHVLDTEPALEPFEIEWNGKSDIKISDTEKLLTSEQLISIGLDTSKKLRLTSKEGGVRVKPNGRARSTTLKKALYEKRIPLWDRERAVTIYQDDDLFGVYALKSGVLEQLIELTSPQNTTL